MTAAVERLKKAHIYGEKVTIWGDFDADGVTATSVLWDGLGQFFTQIDRLDYYIPDRLKESHGLNLAGIKKLAAQLSLKYDVEIDVLLLAWILKHPAGILPVFGTTDKNRISKLAKANKINLDLEDWFAIWTASLGNKVP